MGISKLSNDMLSYAKEDALHVKSVDINQLIRTDRNAFENILCRHGLTIEYVLSPINPVWAMDEVQSCPECCRCSERKEKR
jgi:signal transduction histidine kinase